ncbi:striatin isoform X3 [Chrysoperla carnea]|uniref:striatin isoform X3 n=1 Tax=Chrysoperla carnea TaxID=189513 RepID=UPI001D07FB90|nr:striatin isoform X3 [Chrysoperla carnea]
MKIPSQCGAPTMEDNSVTNQNGGQLGPQTGSIINNKQNDEPNQTPQYSIPGILHFIQHEWARFELERSQWEVDRAELQARIAFLQGERKGQENLKNDLVRRIKMLEYALKQERAKFHKLKYGVDLNQGEIKPPVDDPVSEMPGDSEAPFSSVSNVTWRQGRQLLRQYLQEIGYTDTIIDVRSNRVRSLLGLNNNAEQEENLNGSNINSNESNKRASENPGRRTPAKKAQPSSLAEAMILDTEAAVMANFEFLQQQDVDMEDDDDMSDDLDLDTTEEVDDDVRSAKSHVRNKGKSSIDENMDGGLGLGELAQLTVNNDAEATYDITTNKEAFRKTWNAKYTLRSHFDGVRALAFHPTESVLITASEDHTLKLWNLQKTVPAKKSASLDVEPLYTFRSHSGPVLCLAMSGMGDQCYSGGLDGIIRCWAMPHANIDPYDSFEPSVLSASLEGHTDAIWGLAVHNQRLQLLSASADGTVKLWSPQTKVPLLNSFTTEQDAVPTSVDFVRDETNRIISAYNNGYCIIYDSERATPVVKFEATQDITSSATGRQINRVVCHPTLPLSVTAHEDRHIRFWDNNTGKIVHSMVAHLEAVTSLAIDPTGLYLLSGSHDCSIRLWHLDNKTCVQEITAHRKKFDESILDVAFHPSRPFIASAGADGLAKVFV